MQRKQHEVEAPRQGILVVAGEDRRQELRSVEDLDRAVKRTEEREVLVAEALAAIDEHEVWVLALDQRERSGAIDA